MSLLNKVFKRFSAPFAGFHAWRPYRPLRIFLGFVFLLLLVDAALVTVFVSWHWVFAVLVSAYFISWCWRSGSLKVYGEDDEGWNLGEALDIENPKNPVRIKNFTLQDKVLKLGFLVLGSPGAGKTISAAVGVIYYLSVLFPERTGRRLGWGYYDGKGDGEIYQTACACGAEPDYFFSSELPHTDTLNLFTGSTSDTVDKLTRLLIDENANPFYANEQKATIQTVVPFIKDAAAKKPRTDGGVGVPVTLRDLYILLKVEDAPTKLLTQAKAWGVDPGLLRMADDYFCQEYGERQQLLKGLLNKLYVFVNGAHNDRINDYNPTIDLEQAVNSGKRIYFHMPLSDYARDISFAISETMGAIARDRQNDIKKDRSVWHQFFDDWGGFFYEGIAKQTARGRAAGMPSSYFFQSKDQTDEISATFAGQLDDTVPSKIYLRLSGQKTRVWASEGMGTFDDIQYSTSDRKDDRMDGSSYGEREALRVRPVEFKALHDGEAFITSSAKHGQGEITDLAVKVRFPLPKKTRDPQTIDWPKPVLNEPAEGLGLWDQYMSRGADIAPPAKDRVEPDMAEASGTTTEKVVKTEAASVPEQDYTQDEAAFFDDFEEEDFG